MVQCVIKEYPTKQFDKSSNENMKEDMVKSQPEPDVLETSFEQSTAVAEKPRETIDKIVPDQLIPITEAPSSTFTDQSEKQFQ